METVTMTEKSFHWKGYLWQTCMENGRRIHTGQPWMWYSDDEVLISDNDSLVLTIHRDEREIRHWDGRTYKPAMACGTVRSVDTFGHGEFEAMIELPFGTCLWPSFWLVGDERWPFSGEIDICEAWSDNGSYFKLFIPQPPYLSPSWRTTTNIHFSDNNFIEHASIGSRNISVFKQCKDPSTNPIKYKCVWEHDEIAIYANGKLVRRDTESAKKIQDYWHYIGKEPRMRVIFSFWCENPSMNNVRMNSNFVIKDFSYKAF